MREALLHMIWKTKRVSLHDLKTTEGVPVQIIHHGVHNHDAGPDFLDAKVQIGDTLWAGHVEIHVKSSDWHKHQHHHDPAYNNVILHVVHEDDKPIANEKGRSIPTITLEDRIPERYIRDHDILLQSLSWIPCAATLPTLNQDKWPFYLERLLVQRLEAKHDRIRDLLDKTTYDWEEVLYKLILRYMGLKVNGDAFEMLSDCLPYAILKKQAPQLIQLEALLLGQAGLLRDADEYTTRLLREYTHLKNKHTLHPMTGVEWKFSKLRPANFPTLRMAQVAALYHKTPQLFSALVEASDSSAMASLFKVQASAYWDQHFIPAKTSSTTKTKVIGATTIQVLLINVVAPLLFAYGTAKGEAALRIKATDLLSDLKAEKNGIINRWKEHGLHPDSAAQSQALLELKTHYCDKLRCLDCSIGQQIIFTGVSHPE